MDNIEMLFITCLLAGGFFLLLILGQCIVLAYYWFKDKADGTRRMDKVD